MEALQRENMADGSSLMDALISALVDPVPFGPDGECENDTEFQENLVRSVSILVSDGCDHDVTLIQTVAHLFRPVRR